MCGIIGAYGYENIVLSLYNGLITLQHRGQDAAGIVTFNGRFNIKKGTGLVSDIFRTKAIMRLGGKIGIGHTRYPTHSGINVDDAQPFVVNSPYGIAMAHNGNVTNYKQLKKELFKKDLRILESGCDVEIVLNVLSSALEKKHTLKPKPNDFFNGVKEVFERVNGSYSVVALIANQGLLAFRDPMGIKPLILGIKKKDNKTSYLVASESVTLDILGYTIVGDIKPGEAIFVDKKHKLHSKQIVKKTHYPCIFEYVYFARPDSVIDEISVYKTRLRLGEEVAAQWKKENKDVDVVIPVPESPKPAALTLAHNLDKKYREGLVKNRYIGRTFIMPGQAIRKKSIKQKLNPIKLEIDGKKILLLDDSIVRGNTSKQIIKMVKETGAEKVYLAIYSPPIKFPCVYGIDMSTRNELIGSNKTIKEIEKAIGADTLTYLPIEAMVRSCVRGNPKQKTYCTACFSGKYPTKDVTESTLKEIEKDKLACRSG